MGLLETINTYKTGLTAAFISVALYTSEGIAHNGIANDPGRPDPRVIRTVRLENTEEGPPDLSNTPHEIIPSPPALELPEGVIEDASP